MSSLTIEKMDQINFLITEVSLECLGNKFFDVYGNQADSLLRLISVNSLKSKPTDTDDESDLWNSLTATKVSQTTKAKSGNRQAAAMAAATAAAAVTPKPNKKQLKRRASFSITNNESDDPESLLVPMAPKAAKIANRRSTISVQVLKARNKPVSGTANSVPMQMKTRRQGSAPLQSNHGKSIADIKQDLKRNTDARKYFDNLIALKRERKRTIQSNEEMTF